MPGNIRQVNTAVVIGGNQLPIVGWHLTLASNGSLGTAHVETTGAVLSSFGLQLSDFFPDSDEDVEMDIYAGYDGSYTLLYSGVIKSFLPKFKTDLFTIESVDFATVMTDTKHDISSINYKNQTVGQIVQQIADLYGFTQTNITDPGTPAGPFGPNQTNNTYAPAMGRTAWDILKKLAEDSGYEVYVKPDKTLYFGPPEQLADITTIWCPAPNTTVDANPTPLFDIDGDYSPRDNTNFTVVVNSAIHRSPAANSTTLTPKAPAISRNRKNRNSYTSQTLNGNRIPGAGTKASQKPKFTFNPRGLNAQQARFFAKGKADEIAKRAVIIHGEVEGLPNLKIHSGINLTEGQVGLAGFAGQKFYVTAAEHDMRFPSEDGDGGWFTHFTAMCEVEY